MSGVSKIKINHGDRFGRWTIVSQSKSGAAGRIWLCKCDCGTVRTVEQLSLRLGKSRSCGCLRSQLQSVLASSRARRHGESNGNSREYCLWAGIIDRCTNSNSPAYRNYGGRGIMVCDRWRNSYEAFLADMGRRPEPGMTIDRIDNDGGYSPGNVRWATRKEQARNMRSNRLMEFNGKIATIAEWAEAVGIKYPTLRKRLVAGWPMRLAMTLPILSKHSCGLISASSRWHGKPEEQSCA